MHRTVSIAILAAALSAPMAALADPASTTVNISGTVAQACLLGQPSEVNLTLGDLTGADGRLTAALASATSASSTTIETAWCNGPSLLSLDASPLTLAPTPGYATPAGFARRITYDAALTGWTSPVTDRPLVGDAAKTTTAAGAHANTLTLDISRLATLNSDGTAEAAGLVLEAGSYAGAVVVSLAVN